MPKAAKKQPEPTSPFGYMFRELTLAWLDASAELP